MARILQDMSLEEQDDCFNDIDDYFNDIEIKDIIKKSVKTYNKVETKQENLPFRCRLCGHTKYEGIYGDSSMIPLGGRQYPIAYQCSGCSVIFKDFIKFSVKE